MEKTTLDIMAAGLGSRYKGGLKQLEPIGPNGEIIMDYSIYDALEAGFNDVVIIIRKELEEDFTNIIGNRISKIVDYKYCYQDINNIPAGFKVNDRIKPWGTGQAVLSAKGVVEGKFLVINADDYYGKEAFKKVHEYLIDSKENEFCMAGFILKNTLSENGGVTRGVCNVNSNNFLEKVTETSNITKDTDLNLELFVSMNVWGFSPHIFKYLEEGFVKFLDKLEPTDIKSEYLLPGVIDNLLHEGKVTVKVLKTEDKWFGVTYIEDRALVKKEIAKLVETGVYPKDLSK
jgi:dTDP-glucose pyrophosphorylase